MWQSLEKAFFILLSLAFCTFSFVGIEEVGLSTIKDYHYVLIGVHIGDELKAHSEKLTKQFF